MLIVGEKIIQESQIKSNLYGYICCSSALLNVWSLRQYQVLVGVTVYLAPYPPIRAACPPGAR